MIPDRLTRFPFKYVLKNLVEKCDAVIQANVERKDFVVNTLRINPEKIGVLENFVDQPFLNLLPGILPAKVSNWLDQKSYFLAQGGGDPGFLIFKILTEGIKKYGYFTYNNRF